MPRTSHSSRHDRPALIGLAGMSALALAMGIGRFAFTPLMPLMIRDGLMAPNAGAWLAAANYLGYLLGAVWARSLSAPALKQMRASLLGIALLTLAMGLTQSVLAWAALRCAAGILSATALVATSSWVLQALARLHRASLAGVVYAGVGLGIALAGGFCLIEARPGVGSPRLWLELGLLAGALAAVTLLVLGDPPDGAPGTPPVAAADSSPRDGATLVLCYGIFGFGYILPATFLPALARTLVDDPQRFGLAWPIFGIAAASSTVLAGWVLRRANRLKVWAVCSVLMAVGAALPTLQATLVSVSVAALLVGGTFMIVTMLGLQEARARAPTSPTAFIGRMTSAFALGQILGPVVTGTLAVLSIAPAAALEGTLRLSAATLVASAVLLWRTARRAHG